MLNTANQYAIEILLALLRDPIGYCPTRDGKKIDEDTLFEIAIRNKLYEQLFHFIDCDTCKPYIHKLWIRKVFNFQKTMNQQRMIWEYEKILLDKILKKRCIQGILFKQCSNIAQYSPKILSGSDIDVIVSKKSVKIIIEDYKKMGYELKHKGPLKEIQLVNKKFNFSIDLHFLLAYPHYSTLSKEDYEHVQLITSDLLINSRNKGYGLIEPTPEWYFLSLLIRYWYNDLMTGLRDLHTIVSIAINCNETNFWKNIISRSSLYNFQNKIFFTISLGSTIIQMPLPKSVQRSIPLWVHFLSQLVSVENIVVYPQISKWNRKFNSNQVLKLYMDFYYIKSILESKNILFVVFHPRILRYFIKLISQKRKAFYY